MTFEFDLLGRLKKRIEPEGASEWIWGVSSAIKNIGRLYSVIGPGYSETYEYDSLGRPKTTWVSADASYQIDYSYNDIGALDTLTYPTSTDTYRLKLKYEYQFGQPYRIRDFANTPTPVNYWTANATNARGQITKETLGNNLITSRNYDWATGLMGSIQTGLNEVSYVQDYRYEWDSVGNLKKRKDFNQSGLTEEFFYDNLYRLDYSQRNGVTNLDMAYDAMGNLDSKSEVGSYTYHPTKKHQVASTSNGWSFGYDGNGNMTSGRGRNISWTSYNYPLCVTSGTDCTGTTSDYSKFSYTPDRQHWKQESSYAVGGAATTSYIGGILEKVTTSAGTDYRHMISAGGATVIVSRKTSGANADYYVTSDHLGSSSAITNNSGGILVNSSFDAFGRRRGSNWSGSPSVGDWTAIASTTRRGYTDHSMLDNLELTHMNGRVYDPLIGRFLSADPYITYPEMTQSYNRYSYAQNNPLSRFDPGGFNDMDMYYATVNEDREVHPFASMVNMQSFFEGNSRDLSASNYTTGLQAAQSLHLNGFRGVNGSLGSSSLIRTPIGSITQECLTCIQEPETSVTSTAMNGLITAGQIALPGYAASLHSEAAFRSGQYGWGAAYAALSGAELVMAVLTAGLSNVAMTSSRAGSFVVRTGSQAGRGLGPAGSGAGQLTANACGMACGQRLLAGEGISVFQSNLARGFYRGLTPEQLAANLNRFSPGYRGFYAYPTAAQLSGVASNGQFIARLGGNPGHFVTVESISNGVVRFFDPAGGIIRTQALDNFAATVSGLVVR